jgi:glucan phosphorylase
MPGVDVWLNNPEYPLEASGTSGQKAGLNGTINLSVLDGWWAEGYDGHNGSACVRTDHRRMRRCAPAKKRSNSSICWRSRSSRSISSATARAIPKPGSRRRKHR